MRDIIWTVIIIWVIWRVISAFKSFSTTARNAQNNAGTNRNYNQNTNHTTNHNTQPKKGELKSDAGEYVDYEEVK